MFLWKSRKRIVDTVTGETVLHLVENPEAMCHFEGGVIECIQIEIKELAREYVQTNREAIIKGINLDDVVKSFKLDVEQEVLKKFLNKLVD